MTFKYFDEFWQSLKTVSDNKYLYYGSLILLLISTGLSLLPSFFLNSDFTTAAGLINVVIGMALAFVINLFVIAVSVYMMTAVYNSVCHILQGEKLSLHQFYENGFNRFWSFLGLGALIYVAVLLIYLIIGMPGFFVVGIMQATGNYTLMIIPIILFVLALGGMIFIGYKLMYAFPALAQGQSIIDAWKTSWTCKTKNHQLKTLGVLLLVGVITMVVYAPYYAIIYVYGSVWTQQELLAFITIYVMLSLFVVTYIGIANYVFLFKSYLYSLKSSK